MSHVRWKIEQAAKRVARLQAANDTIRDELEVARRDMHELVEKLGRIGDVDEAPPDTMAYEARPRRD